MIRLVASRARRTARPRTRRGFTLVELIVAMLLLSVGVLGLAGVSAYAIRQSNTAQSRNLATNVAESRMEELRSRSCASITAGSATTNGVSESWTVDASNANTKSRTVTGRFIFTRRSGKNTRPDTITAQTTLLCN